MCSLPRLHDSAFLVLARLRPGETLMAAVDVSGGFMSDVFRTVAEYPEALPAFGLIILLLALSGIRELPAGRRWLAFLIGFGTLAGLVVGFGVAATVKAEARERAREAKATADSQAEARIIARVIEALDAQGVRADATTPIVQDYPTALLPEPKQLALRRRDPDRDWKSTNQKFSFVMHPDLQAAKWTFVEPATTVVATATSNASYARCSVTEVVVTPTVVTFQAHTTNKHGGATVVCQFDLSAVISGAPPKPRSETQTSLNSARLVPAA